MTKEEKKLFKSLNKLFPEGKLYVLNVIEDPTGSTEEMRRTNRGFLAHELIYRLERIKYELMKAIDGTASKTEIVKKHFIEE